MSKVAWDVLSAPNKSNIAWDILDEPEEENDGFLDAVGGGFGTLWANTKAAWNTYAGDNEDVINNAQEASYATVTPDQRAFRQSIAQRMQESDEGIIDGIANVVGAVWDSPKGAMHEMGAQLPNAGAAMSGMLAGGAAGSLAGPVGTVVGGIVGLFAGNTLIETGAKATEKAGDGDFTEEERAETIKEGLTKGGVITGVDAATLGLSKVILGVPGRAVEQAVTRTLVDRGVDVTNKTAINAAMKSPEIAKEAILAGGKAFKEATTTGSNLLRGGLAMTNETLGEGVGEFLGEYAATGQASATDAVLESLMSMPLSVGELKVANDLNTAGTNTGLLQNLANVDLRNEQSRQTTIAQAETKLANARSAAEAITAANELAEANTVTPQEQMQLDSIFGRNQNFPPVPTQSQINQREIDAITPEDQFQADAKIGEELMKRPGKIYNKMPQDTVGTPPLSDIPAKPDQVIALLEKLDQQQRAQFLSQLDQKKRQEIDLAYRQAQAEKDRQIIQGATDQQIDTASRLSEINQPQANTAIAEALNRARLPKENKTRQPVSNVATPTGSEPNQAPISVTREERQVVIRGPAKEIRAKLKENKLPVGLVSNKRGGVVLPIRFADQVESAFGVAQNEHNQVNVDNVAQNRQDIVNPPIDNTPASVNRNVNNIEPIADLPSAETVTQAAADVAKTIATVVEKETPRTNNKQPWEMTSTEWNSEREKARPNVAQSNFTRASGSESVAMLERSDFLTYGVKDAASARMKAAMNGDIKLTKDELEDLDFELNTRTRHRDVIAKAVSEGKPVPEDILSEYPDIVQKQPASISNERPESVDKGQISEQILKQDDDINEDVSAPRFSRSSDYSSVAVLWQALGQKEDLYQNNKSEAKSIKDIAEETSHKISVINLAPSKPSIEKEYRLDMQTGEDTLPVYVRENKDGTIEMNAARLVSGKSRGSAAYHIVASYAHNTGKVFIGDTDGLSEDAKVRRTENMLSSALKYGTTRHIKPHPSQGIAWVDGDDQANIAALIDAHYNNAVKAVPAIKDITYDFETGTFRYRPKSGRGGSVRSEDAGGMGQILNDDHFRRIARDSRGARAAKAGPSTLKRAVITNTLLQGARGEGRRGFLEAFARKLYSELDPAVKDILYSRESVPTESATTSPVLSQDAVETIVGNIAFKRFPRLRVSTVAVESELPQSIQDQAKKDGATGEIKAVYYKGTVHVVSSKMTSETDVEEALAHEASGHYGSRLLFGDDIKPAFNKMYFALRSSGVKSIAEKHGIDMKGYFETAKTMPYPDRAMYLVDELLSHMQGEAVYDSLPERVKKAIQAFWGAIRDKARKLGFTRISEYSDSDLQYLLSKMRKAAKEGKEAKADDRPMFMVGDMDNAQSIDTEEVPMFSRSRNEAVREQNKTIIDKAKSVLQRNLTSRGLLPESVFNAKIERDSEMGAVEMDIQQLVRRLENAVKSEYGKAYSKLSEDEISLLNNALGSGFADIKQSNIPENVQVAIAAMREYIDKQSRDYSTVLLEDAERLISEDKSEAAQEKYNLLDTIAGNIGSYVNRSYRAFDDPDWFKKIPDSVLDNAREYLESRGARNPDVVIETITKEGTAADSMEAFIKESKLGAKDLSILKRRKEIAPEIRALLGEYQDPRVNFAKSATKMSRLLFNDRFLKEVKRLGEDTFLFTDENRPVGAYKKLAADGSEVYAPLNGYYTYPEIEQAFKDALGKEQLPDWYKAIVQVNGMVKYGKTVLSPTTAARNWMSAYFFTVANGHFNLKYVADSIKSMKSYFKQDGGKFKYLRELKENGVIYDTPYAGEMMRLLEDTNLDDKYVRNNQSIKSVLDVFTKFYQFGDDFWKIVGVENEIAILMKHKGLSRKEALPLAAKRIRETYPTYSMVGRMPQKLRRFPLAGTFVSFPAEIVRTSFHILKYLKQEIADPDMRPVALRRMAGLAVASGFAYALQEAAKGMIGMDDDEEEAMRVIAPKWSKNSNIMPIGRDEKGNIRYIDLSFLDPYNYWKRPITALMRDEPMDDQAIEAAREMLEPFFGEDITFGTIAEIWHNRKESGGQVYNEADSPVQITARIADHLRRGLQPGVVANIENMVSALHGYKSRSGRVRTVEDEIAANLGFRISTIDPGTSMFYRAYEFKDIKANATSILSKVATDPNSVSDDELLSAYKRAEDARAGAYRDMNRLVSAAKKSGMTNSQIRQILRANNISKTDVAALLKGEIPKWRPSKTYLRSAIKKAEAIYSDDEAGMFKNRREYIQSLATSE